MIQPNVDYPPDLPLPLLPNRQISNVDTMMTTTMASGRRRWRRRFGNAPASVSVTFLMPNAKSEIFRGWYRWELNDGAEWFNIRLRVDNGIQTYAAHFDRIYDGPNPAGFLAVSYTATLVLWERPAPTEDQYAEDGLLGMDLDEALALIEDVNTHWVPGWPQGA